jgi:PKD repeat protein
MVDWCPVLAAARWSDMRVGSLVPAGPLIRRLLLLPVLVLALPAASAQAQAPAPVDFVDPPSGVRSATSETIAFSAPGAERYTCRLDEGAFVDCTSPQTLTELSNRSHVFAVRGLDADGAEVAAGEVTWVVDLDKPVVSFISGPEGDTPTGDALVAFRASADTAVLECSADGTTFTTCSSPHRVTVAPGDGSLHVQAVDEAGNIGDAAVRSWFGIAPPPAGVPAIAGGPAEGSRTASRSASFTFTASGAVRFECGLGETDPVFAGCPPLTGLADGPYVLNVRGIDAGGTPGPVAQRRWVVDGTAPRVVLTDRPDAVTGSLSFSFSFTVDDPTARLECLLDGRTLDGCQPGAAIAAQAARDGRHTLVVRATDAAGNRGEDTATWLVDLDLPVATIVTAPADPTNALEPAFTLASSETPATFECRLLAAGRVEPFAACGARRAYPGLAEGRYTFEARALDAARNPSAVASRTFTVDRTGPRIDFSQAPPAATAAASLDLAWTGSEPLTEVTCLLDGAAAPCGPAGATVPNARLALGSHTFTVRAQDAAGNAGTQSTSWTTSFEPDFVADPASPVIDRPVTFTSLPGIDIAEWSWDLDGDGSFADAAGPTAQRTFAAPGSYDVALRARHRDGETRTVVHRITVGRAPLTADPPVAVAAERRPPVASFAVAPQPLVAGQAVNFTSTSADPDGSIASWAWDLDGDGLYDDATGPAASRVFPAGTHLVGLRVVDADSLAATAFSTIEVGAAPGTPARPSAPAPPKALTMLTPFPVVRIAGTAVGARVRLRIFAVRAPRGATVDVRCKGRGCPFSLDRHRVVGKARTVRIRKLERTALRAGTVLEVRVHAAGRIGKYTRLVMRSGAAPKRTDACVTGTRLAKAACPA